MLFRSKLKMNCECKETIQGKLAAKHLESNPEDENVSAAIQGYKLLVNFETGKMRTAGTLPITISYSRKNRKGETKSKTSKSFMFFNYCPFCGKSVAGGENDKT